MAFRKRNAPVNSAQTPSKPGTSSQEVSKEGETEHPFAQKAPGIRPSPADGRLTTSTGTPSLDGLFAGHAGLPLGHSLLIEETGTTDYASALLRCFAAEGIAQGHHVHVIGPGPGWVKELPGLVEGRGEKKGKGVAQSTEERMKIAWRYERQEGISNREPPKTRNLNSDADAEPSIGAVRPFCHTFDLAKRLEVPPSAKIYHHPLANRPSIPPFSSALDSIRTALASSPGDIHRLVIPSLLSPLFYPPHASQPQHVLQFLHALRALLREHSSGTSVIASLPLTLHPRASALTRWSEHLLDGVVELAPFPFRPDDYVSNRTSTPGAATAAEERPQGMVKVHKLPVFHERGGGGGVKGLGEDMAFTVSRRRFAIGRFSLPPEEGDQEAQREKEGSAIEF